MVLKQFSEEAIAELLVYLAKNEKFDSIKNIKSFSREDVSDIFKALAKKITDEISLQPVLKRESLHPNDFSDNLNHVIAKLSPDEEQKLLKSFKIGS